MEPNLSAPEKEHLRRIADALERRTEPEIDETLVGALIRKCMVRTNGKALKITDLGRRALRD